MSCKTGYFVGGLFIGTVIGGALGVLLAPESGEETRNRIKENAEGTFGDMYDQAVEYGETLKEQFQDATDTLTDHVNQYRTQIEDKIQEIQEEVNQDIDELNQELEALKAEEEAEEPEEDVAEEAEEVEEKEAPEAEAPTEEEA